jgi:hypothetical protein
MQAQRNRTVIFRVTQDEYDRLIHAVETSGSRSVSDYARTALLHTATESRLGSAVQLGLGEMNQKVSELREMMEHLASRRGVRDPES